MTFQATCRRLLLRVWHRLHSRRSDIGVAEIRRLQTRWAIVSDISIGVVGIAGAALVGLMCTTLSAGGCVPYRAISFFLTQWSGIFFAQAIIVAICARITRARLDAGAGMPLKPEPHFKPDWYARQPGVDICTLVMIANAAFGFAGYMYFSNAAFLVQNQCFADQKSLQWRGPITTPWAEAWKVLQGQQPTIPISTP
jgi:hypothetical protein